MNHRWSEVLTLPTLALAAFATTTTSSIAQQYVPLPAGYAATDVTPDGRIVVGHATGGNGFIWRWKQDPLPTVIPGSGIWGTSDDGTVLVGNVQNLVTNKYEAARWTQATGWQLLGGLPGATGCDAYLSSAYDISGDGTVIVGLAYGGATICQSNGFRWTQATGMQAVQLLGNAYNRVSSISRDGSTMGGFAQGNFSRTPAYWDSALIGLMPDMNYQGEVYGFNNDGSKSLGSSFGAAPFQGAYIRDRQSGVMTNLGTLNAGWTGNARDMSEDGNVIVGYDSLMLGREAWVWTSSDGIISLNTRLAALGVAGVPPLSTCVACSDDGSVIVGGGNLSPGYIAELPGYVPFGTGTAGCAGLPVLSASPFPIMNTPVLTFTSTNAPPNSLGLVLITDVPDQFGSDPFGIGVQLHVNLFAATQLITLDAFSDPFGTGGALANIPNNPALVGQTYFVQILWAWPTSTCFIPPFGLSTTNGLAMTINP